jgi:nifR3 family TIM-barrel protein
MEWYIGNVKIANQVILAPMAGISNSSFRRICKEMGAGLVYAEMVSDKAIYYENKKTIDLLYMRDEERPIAQQIFGSDKESFVYAAKYIVENMKPDILDINMGCPVPKVALRAQAGSALLKNPKKVYEIVKAVVDTVNIPVTVKIRSGWDMQHINAVLIAKECEKAGASAIIVHPRTRSQGYSGKADWSIIKEVKDNVSIPVIGNGDIKTPEDAKRMLEETGCDAVMVGRAVLGNPWLISRMITYLETNVDPGDPSLEERFALCKKHAQKLINVMGERKAMREMRSHAPWYIKGLHGSAKIKNELTKVTTYKEMIDILDAYEHDIESYERG